MTSNRGEENLKTLFQLFSDNQEKFPFWVAPWRPYLTILLVKGWVLKNYGLPKGSRLIFDEIIDPNEGYFLADLYMPDKQICVAKNNIVAVANQPCWQFI